LGLVVSGRPALSVWVVPRSKAEGPAPAGARRVAVEDPEALRLVVARAEESLRSRWDVRKLRVAGVTERFHYRPVTFDRSGRTPATPLPVPR
jgi:hypothetical protein